MRKLSALVLGLAMPLLLVGGAAAAPRSSTATDAMIYAVHAIPDLPVDVYVDGALTIPDFLPGTIAGPLTVPAGSYTVDITAINDPGNPILSADLSVKAGKTYSAVAYLMEDGTPTLGAFLDPMFKSPKGNSGIVIRHTAAAPAVDVKARTKNGTSAFTLRNLENGKQAITGVQAPRSYSASVYAAGTDTLVIGPAQLKTTQCNIYFVYAWGSLSAGNLGLIVQERHTGCFGA
jgi:hypothetical protein